MKIIVGGRDYPVTRNILTDSSHHYLDYRLKNVWTWINAIRQRLLRRNKLFLFQSLPFVSSAEAEIIHLFNEVATGTGNWVATFETELPRVLPVRGIEKFKNPELYRELGYVSSSRCKGIIAISNATHQIQLQLLEHFPDERALILSKLHVLHPPQGILHVPATRAQSGPLTFTFVGKEFYRKGGAEIVLAFSQLYREGVISEDDVHVNLVGDTTKTHNVAHGDFQDNDAFREEVERELREIPVFNHFKTLSNSAVLELIKSSDLGLLPTWHDTYGFSVLEMQACGCPVITTNVRALPEINPENAGWIIWCPLNRMLELSVASAEDKYTLRNTIISQLKSYIALIIRDRHVILATKGAKAIERIRREHDPDTFRKRLNDIYADSLMSESMVK
ncbi:glycosyltransferase [Candidatus Pantoea formicae]|uniref:glycosyltransferase n=1 Tax=Candidatus Pantoea formicae TaxID=2608355 RepID=UPI003ED940E9